MVQRGIKAIALQPNWCALNPQECNAYVPFQVYAFQLLMWPLAGDPGYKVGHGLTSFGRQRPYFSPIFVVRGRYMPEFRSNSEATFRPEKFLTVLPFIDLEVLVGSRSDRSLLLDCLRCLCSKSLSQHSSEGKCSIHSFAWASEPTKRIALNVAVRVLLRSRWRTLKLNFLTSWALAAEDGIIIFSANSADRPGFRTIGTRLSIAKCECFRSFSPLSLLSPCWLHRFVVPDKGYGVLKSDFCGTLDP